MTRTKDMIKKFRKMSPLELKGITNKQAKSLLAIFHAQLHTNPSERQQTGLRKKKTIRRFSSKSAYKTYVRANICKIMQKSLGTICNKREPLELNTLKDLEAEERGSSNLKYSSKQKHLCKKINLHRNMTQALNSSNLEELCCSICLQLLICPTLTICGHVFCYQCLDESLLFSHNCPNCRENIKGSQLIRCVVLDSIIKRKHQLSPSEHLMSHNDYDQRTRKFKDWQLRRILNVEEIYIGQVVDVRDTETIWCQGTIAKIYKRYERSQQKYVVSSILMHYNRWHSLYNEIIQIPTNRIAPLNYFSTRIDIPRYNLSEIDNNMRGTVVSGVRMEQPHTIQIMESDDEEFDDDEPLVDVDADGDGDEEEENEQMEQHRDRQIFDLFNNLAGERQQNNGFSMGNLFIPTLTTNNRRYIFANRDRPWAPIRPRFYELRRPQQELNLDDQSIEELSFGVDYHQNESQEEMQSQEEEQRELSQEIIEQQQQQQAQQHSDWFDNVSMRNFSSNSERKQNSIVEIKDSEDNSRQVLVQQDVEIMMVDDLEDMVDDLEDMVNDLDDMEERMAIE